MEKLYEWTKYMTYSGLEVTKEMTLVEKVKHGEYYIEAAWPLGTASLRLSHLKRSTKRHEFPLR